MLKLFDANLFLQLFFFPKEIDNFLLWQLEKTTN